MNHSMIISGSLNYTKGVFLTTDVSNLFAHKERLDKITGSIEKENYNLNENIFELSTDKEEPLLANENSEVELLNNNIDAISVAEDTLSSNQKKSNGFVFLNKSTVFQQPIVEISTSQPNNQIFKVMIHMKEFPVNAKQDINASDSHNFTIQEANILKTEGQAIKLQESYSN